MALNIFKGKLLQKSNFIPAADIELMHKNAKAQGMTFETIQPVEIPAERVVDVSETTVQQDTQIETTDLTTTTLPLITTPNVETVINSNPEGIVGQQAPSVRRRFNLLSQRRQLSPHQVRSAPVEQQRTVIQQIKDHLNHLSKADDVKTKQGALDDVRSSLKELSEMIAAEEGQQKSLVSADRLKTIVQQVKEKQHRHRLAHHSPRVLLPHLTAKEKTPNGGSLTGKENNENGLNEVEEPKNRKQFILPRPHFDIITQNPSLIDD